MGSDWFGVKQERMPMKLAIACKLVWCSESRFRTSLMIHLIPLLVLSSRDILEHATNDNFRMYYGTGSF